MGHRSTKSIPITEPSAAPPRGTALMPHRLPIFIAAIVALVSVQAAHAADPAVGCESSKLKASGKYVSCLLGAEAKALLKGVSPDYTKCGEKIDKSWSSAETKGAGECPNGEGDQSEVQSFLDSCSQSAADALDGTTPLPADPITCDAELTACEERPLGQPLKTGQTTSYGAGDDGDLQPGVALQYTDNGDGTITDRATGLMWEKKILLNGYTPCTDETGTCANPHNADNGYSWGAASAPPFDGTVVTIFLEQLNNRCDQDTTVPCTVDADCAVPGGTCGFAGHRDWRLPTIKELQSLVDYSKEDAPAVDAAFSGVNCGAGCTDIKNPACSCTSTWPHWSSTSVNAYWDAGAAWSVDFWLGQSLPDYGKTYREKARAVRGGS